MKKRRARLMKEKKKEAEVDRDVWLRRPRNVPYRKPADVPLDSKDKDENIKKQLEHNLEILKALQAEYDREEEMRKQVNKQLEEEGAYTIKEKMDLMAKKAGQPKELFPEETPAS